MEVLGGEQLRDIENIRAETTQKKFLLARGVLTKYD